jgi:hypothetical protein
MAAKHDCDFGLLSRVLNGPGNPAEIVAVLLLVARSHDFAHVGAHQRPASFFGGDAKAAPEIELTADFPFGAGNEDKIIVTARFVYEGPGGLLADICSIFSFGRNEFVLVVEMERIHGKEAGDFVLAAVARIKTAILPGDDAGIAAADENDRIFFQQFRQVA